MTEEELRLCLNKISKAYPQFTGDKIRNADILAEWKEAFISCYYFQLRLAILDYFKKDSVYPPKVSDIQALMPHHYLNNNLMYRAIRRREDITEEEQAQRLGELDIWAD